MDSQYKLDSIKNMSFSLVATYIAIFRTVILVWSDNFTSKENTFKLFLLF